MEFPPLQAKRGSATKILLDAKLANYARGSRGGWSCSTGIQHMSVNCKALARRRGTSLIGQGAAHYEGKE